MLLQDFCKKLILAKLTMNEKIITQLLVYDKIIPACINNPPQRNLVELKADFLYPYKKLLQ